MICYMDMAFCASENCENKCGRKPPPDLDAKVKAWWGEDGGPVCYGKFCETTPTTKE